MKQDSHVGLPIAVKEQTPFPFRIRRCTLEDAARLSLVGGASFLEAFAEALEDDDILAHAERHHTPDAYRKFFAMPTARVALAEMQPGNGPVGYMVCCEPDLPVAVAPDDYELRRIYLLHRFQGLGIGKALMDAAVGYTRELGRARLLLGVYGKNYDAIRFYEKAGFTQIGERFFTVGAKTHQDAVMARAV